MKKTKIIKKIKVKAPKKQKDRPILGYRKLPEKQVYIGVDGKLVKTDIVPLEVKELTSDEWVSKFGDSAI